MEAVSQRFHDWSYSMLADIPNYDQLSIAAKLQLVDEIWKDIATSGEPFPSDEWDARTGTAASPNQRPTLPAC